MSKIVVSDMQWTTVYQGLRILCLKTHTNWDGGKEQLTNFEIQRPQLYRTSWSWTDE